MSNQPLNMAQLTQPEQPEASATPAGSPARAESPARERKLTYTLELPGSDFNLTNATLQREFKSGSEASYRVHYPVLLVDPPEGKSREDLEPNDEVTINAGNEHFVAATVKAVHKSGTTLTLHIVWEVANARIEPKPEARKRKAKHARAEAPADVPADFVAPMPVAVLFLCEADLYQDATPADVAEVLRKLARQVAPANPEKSFVLLDEPLTRKYMSAKYAKWAEGKSPELLALERDHTVLVSACNREALDLFAIRHLVAKHVPHDTEFAVVLAHGRTATVVDGNLALPNMAFGDDSWVQRVEGSSSTAAAEPDSGSDHESTPVDDVHRAEPIDLTAPDEPDAPPARPRAEKRKRPAEVEYVVLDDSDSDE